jgi:hypothetical protein
MDEVDYLCEYLFEEIFIMEILRKYLQDDLPTLGRLAQASRSMESMIWTNITSLKCPNNLENQHLIRMVSLTRLDLDWNQTITDAGLAPLVHLQHLDLGLNNKITDAMRRRIETRPSHNVQIEEGM